MNTYPEKSEARTFTVLTMVKYGRDISSPQSQAPINSEVLLTITLQSI